MGHVISNYPEPTVAQDGGEASGQALTTSQQQLQIEILCREAVTRLYFTTCQVGNARAHPCAPLVGGGTKPPVRSANVERRWFFRPDFGNVERGKSHAG